jgi:hypothetical protein
MAYRLPHNPHKVELREMVYEHEPSKPKPYRKVVVEGWDTETQPDGFAWVLSSSDEWVEVESWHDIESAFLQRRHRGKRNFWWNLDFDVTACLKWHPEAWYMVTKTGAYQDEDLSIFYIPKKLFKVSRGKHTSVHYDIMQFYRMALAKAAKTFLNEEQHEIKSLRDALWSYYQDGKLSLNRVGSYCQWDSTMTRRLAERYVGGLHKVGLYPKHFISKGNLAENAIRAHGDVPTWRNFPYHVNRMAWSAYRGGWFDLWQKGTVDVWKYDIKSAYPHAMRHLPDFRLGEWVSTYEKGMIGFVRCNLQATMDTPPMLAGWFGSSHLYHEIDVPIRATLTNAEYEFLRTRAKIEPLVFRSFVPSKESYPWRNVLDRFLLMKDRAPKGTAEYTVIKEIVNSSYGKTCQVVRRKDRETGSDAWTFTAGRLFCPVAAATITGACRVQVAEAVSDCLNDVVMIATDSVATTRPLRLDVGEEVGQWEVEAEGDRGTFIKPGIYQVDGDFKPHTRGFKPEMWKVEDGEEEYKPLREYCKTDAESFSIEWRAPVSSRMALHREDFSMANVWEPIPRDITCNDARRLWERRASFKELLNGVIRSTPVPLSLTAGRLS